MVAEIAARRGPEPHASEGLAATGRGRSPGIAATLELSRACGAAARSGLGQYQQRYWFGRWISAGSETE
jgi:hypothetical protein